MKDKRRLLMLSADYECTDCGIGWWKGINGHYIEEEPAERSKPCSKCGMHSMSWEQRDG
jgi:DNA-directed RNA polymerase subunit M/transcription elongation factor TFIIS